MSEGKVNLYKIIRDKWQYRLEEVERKVIIDIAKEACRQVLELAAENAIAIGEGTSLNTKSGNLMWTYGGSIGDVIVDKDSILNTINQVE